MLSGFPYNFCFFQVFFRGVFRCFQFIPSNCSPLTCIPAVCTKEDLVVVDGSGDVEAQILFIPHSSVEILQVDPQFIRTIRCYVMQVIVAYKFRVLKNFSHTSSLSIGVKCGRSTVYWFINLGRVSIPSLDKVHNISLSNSIRYK